MAAFVKVSLRLFCSVRLLASCEQACRERVSQDRACDGHVLILDADGLGTKLPYYTMKSRLYAPAFLTTTISSSSIVDEHSPVTTTL